MSSHAALVVALPILLCACQDTQARQQNARLEQRVAALEAEVKSLKAQRTNGLTVDTVTDVTLQAAAQHCAVELARSLELYRQDSLEHRYPSHSEMEVPEACTNQNVQWRKLNNKTYHFQVLGSGGKTLAEQKGP